MFITSTLLVYYVGLILFPYVELGFIPTKQARKIVVLIDTTY